MSVIIDTPGPGQYILPSDFRHLESFRGEGSPRRGNTQSSPRPKMIGRLQLSQMQGGNDPPQLTGLDGTNRSGVKSMTMNYGRSQTPSRADTLNNRVPLLQEEHDSLDIVCKTKTI